MEAYESGMKGMKGGDTQGGVEQIEKYQEDGVNEGRKKCIPVFLINQLIALTKHICTEVNVRSTS